MRVTSGVAKGRVLRGPKGEKIRPVLDKVKQAIFNILGPIEGLNVLDLFAGTGAIGIEALSRGATYVTFVDSSREAIGLIWKNLERCGFQNQAKVLKMRLVVGAQHAVPLQKHDLIFVDPPYDKNLVNPTLKTIVREKLLAPGGTVVVEHSPRELIEEDWGLRVFDLRKYGQTRVSFLR